MKNAAGNDIAATRRTDLKRVHRNVRFWGQSGSDADAPQCPLMTQSGHGSGSPCDVTTGKILDPKRDILFIPDVVLSASKAHEATGFHRRTLLGGSWMA